MCMDRAVMIQILIYKRVANCLLSFKCDKIIAGGVFNLLLEIDKDKKGGRATTHEKSRNEVNIIAQNLDLRDVWRDFNPNDRPDLPGDKKTRSTLQNRLDFFLVSTSLVSNVTKDEEKSWPVQATIDNYCEYLKKNSWNASEDVQSYE